MRVVFPREANRLAPPLRNHIPYVVKIGPEEEVVGTDTQWGIAMMQDAKTAGDWAVVYLPGHSMGLVFSTVAVDCSSILAFLRAGRCFTSPQPTPTWGVLDDFGKEAILESCKGEPLPTVATAKLDASLAPIDFTRACGKLLVTVQATTKNPCADGDLIAPVLVPILVIALSAAKTYLTTPNFTWLGFKWAQTLNTSQGDACFDILTGHSKPPLQVWGATPRVVCTDAEALVHLF